MVSKKIDLTEEEIFKEKKLEDLYLEKERRYRVSEDLIFIYDVTNEKMPLWMNNKVKLITSNYEWINSEEIFYYELKEKYNEFRLNQTERDCCARCGKMTTILKKYDICDKCTSIMGNESAIERILK